MEIKVPYTLFKPTGDRLQEICEIIMQGGIYLKKRYPIIYPKQNIWYEDPLNDRSWRYALHSLFMVEYLINGYETFSRVEYLMKAKDIILDWSKWNLQDSKSDMAWHDHSTAIRLIQISRYYNIYKNIDDSDEHKKIIYDVVEKHAEKLSSDDFYMPKHNHGLDQDLALYIASLVFSDHIKANTWKETSLVRFKKQLDDLFADDGSYLEHSPHYSFLVLDRIIQFTGLLSIFNRTIYTEVIEKLKKQIAFLISMLQPDGTIPPIGDSEEQPITFTNVEGFDPSIETLINKANNFDSYIGELKLEIPDEVFPIGGYAILKNKALSKDELTQIIFCCSFHSRVHKHHDDLSFILYSSGLPIFMDSGKYNYNYKSEERQYVVSSRAHNSVIVDDKDTEIIRLNIGKSAITSFYANNDISFSSGCHCLYPGIIHSRLIVYIKPYDVLIFDHLEGFKSHTFDQNFIVNRNIEVEPKDNTFIGKIENKILFKMIPIYHSNFVDSIIHRGSKNPLNGWISTDYSVLTPATAIRFRNEGQDVRMATHIQLNGLSENENRISDLIWNQEHITFKFDGNDYEFIMLHHKTYALINNQKVSVQHFQKDILMEAIREAKQYEYRQKYRSERERRLKFK